LRISNDTSLNLVYRQVVSLPTQLFDFG
jgi:hypothetical protein